ncbi:hypothetical protein N7471_013444 [Penicillium samsonianum]|uniref:uncharacterized protein n=1 Tax=Penicillium samsonianum TaxID=1882272 RepID=UPI0025498138|nr:uncharacterized protein N7471_013444 [Penicillium samsonianum]KAJ6118824.1 hypothetical protein N7471_013444 [Penicillium samsonianum]
MPSELKCSKSVTANNLRKKIESNHLADPTTIYFELGRQLLSYDVRLCPSNRIYSKVGTIFLFEMLPALTEVPSREFFAMRQMLCMCMPNLALAQVLFVRRLPGMPWLPAFDSSVRRTE